MIGEIHPTAEQTGTELKSLSQQLLHRHRVARFRRALGKTEPPAYTLLRMIERRSWLWRSGVLFMFLAAIGRSPRPARGFT
jgi:hypothetical protein